MEKWYTASTLCDMNRVCMLLNPYMFLYPQLENVKPPYDSCNVEPLTNSSATKRPLKGSDHSLDLTFCQWGWKWYWVVLFFAVGNTEAELKWETGIMIRKMGFVPRPVFKSQFVHLKNWGLNFWSSSLAIPFRTII